MIVKLGDIHLCVCFGELRLDSKEQSRDDERTSGNSRFHKWQLRLEAHVLARRTVPVSRTVMT